MSDNTTKCNVHGCELDAEYWFHNGVTNLRGFKCDEHAWALEHRGYSFEQMLDDGTLKAPQDAPSHSKAEL